MFRTRILSSRLRPPPQKLPIRWPSQRAASTQAGSLPNAATAPRKPRLFRAAYAWYGLVLLSGSAVGFAVRNFAAPMSLPVPGSREDQLALRALTSDLEKLDIVKYMRSQGYHLHDDTPLNSGGESAHKGWVELDIKTHISESKEDSEQKTRTLTWKSLAGIRGCGVQRAFWNAETKELVAIVWIGPALSGWPSYAHGGAIATIFEDCMSRMVVGPSASLDSIAEPTSLSVTYAKPTLSADFYVLRGSFSKPNLPQTAPPPDPEPAPAKSWLPSWKDFTKKKAPVESRKTVEIISTLENTNGKLCVRAKGTFPVSD